MIQKTTLTLAALSAYAVNAISLETSLDATANAELYSAMIGLQRHRLGDATQKTYRVKDPMATLESIAVAGVSNLLDHIDLTFSNGEKL